MNLEGIVLGYLLHLPFDAIGALGPHDDRCTLELQMQPHFLVLKMLVGDGPDTEGHYQSQFVMWLVTLPAQEDHAVPRLILTGWLTRLFEFCDGFCG